MASVTRQSRWLIVRGSERVEDGNGNVLYEGLGTDPVPVGDDWITRVQRVPQLEVVGELGNAAAVDIIVESQTMRGWGQRLRFEPGDDGLELCDVQISRRPALMGKRPNPDGTLPTQSSDLVERRSLSARLLRELGFDRELIEPAKRLLTDDVIRLSFLGPRWAKPLMRPGGAQRSEQFRALWANRYVWALAQDARRPIAVIIDADGRHGIVRTAGEVRNQVAATRPQFLTRASAPGKAGGQLTDLAVKLLAEINVRPGDDVPVRE